MSIILPPSTPVVPAIRPFPWDNTPYTNVTPFTVRDNATMQWELEKVKEWIRDTLIPHTDEEFASLVLAWAENVTSITDGVNEALTDQAAAINAALTTQTAEVQTAVNSMLTYVDNAVQSIINSTIEVTDPVLMGIVSDSEANFTNYLSDNFVGGSAGIFNLRQFGNLLSGNFTDILNAAIAAVPAGSTIVIPPGTYTSTGIIVNSGKSVRIEANGCRFLQDSNNTFAIFTGSWGDVISVYAIETVSANLSPSNTRNVNRILLTAAPDWKPGDVVKIYSNDRVEDGRTTAEPEDSRHGEFATVFSVDGTAVTLIGLLRENYTSNPRVQKLNRVTVDWIGGEYYGSDDSFTNGWTNPVIRMRSLYTPSIVDFKIERSSSIGLDFRSCYFPLVDRYNVNYLADVGELAQLGYAVSDIANEGLTFSNSSIRRIRHAYTDDMARITVDTDDAERHGRSYNARIVNVHVDGSTSGAFSPHHGGWGHKFINCSARRCGNAGFGIRGINHEVIDCSVSDAQHGVTVANEGGGQSYGVKVVNLRSHNVITAHVVDYPNNVQNNPITTHVVGGIFSGTGDLLFSSVGGRMLITGYPRWTAPDSLADGSSAISLTSSSLVDETVIEINGVELDYRGNTVGNDIHVASQGGSAAKRVIARNVIVRNTGLGTRMTAIFDFFSGGSGSSLWNVPDLILDVAPQNYWPADGADEASKITWRTADRSVSSAMYERAGSSMPSAPAPFLNRTPEPVVLLNATADANVSRTLANLPSGAFPGQMLIISWTNTLGAATLTVPNTGNIATGTEADIVLANGKAITLVWTGTVWRPVTP